MSETPVPPALPPALEAGLLQLHTLAALMQCADAAAWETLGRPGPDGLAALLFSIGADVRSGAEDLAKRKAA
jgi:hypothetical protein